MRVRGGGGAALITMRPLYVLLLAEHVEGELLHLGGDPKFSVGRLLNMRNPFAMTKKQKQGECVYCGTFGPITRDHVPPKCLFGSPPPRDLLTVPSCRECNGGASKDDEYFRLMLASQRDVGEHPDAQAVLPDAYRALAMPQKRGFLGAFLRGQGPIDIMSPTGLYLGTETGYEVDLARLSRVAERVAKGLFYIERKRRLASGTRSLCMSERTLERMDAETKRMFEQGVLPPLLAVEPVSIARGVLIYRVSFPPDDANASTWILTFYGKVSFLVVTVS